MDSRILPTAFLMSRLDPTFEADQVLLPLLTAKDDTEYRNILDKLISDHADPVIKTIIRHKLRVSMNQPTGRSSHYDAEDIYGEVVVNILKRLDEFKSNPGEKTIYDFRNYVAVISHRACSKHYREKYPEYWRLKNRLRYLCSQHSEFSVWEGKGREWLTGLRQWSGNPAYPGSETYRQLILDPGAHLAFTRKINSDNAEQMSVLVKAIFGYAEAPVVLDDLVTIVAALSGIQMEGDKEFRGEIADAKDLVKDQTNPILEKMDRVAHLQKIWGEICLLPVKQRCALLLNLRDDDGAGIISLLPITGVVSVRQIAEALEISAEELAKMWNRLPMDDISIADSFGITRQQVINLRKSARERLARRINPSKRSK